MKKPIVIYLVVQPTGVYDANGKEQVILLEAKLTRLSADIAAKKYEKAEIVKLKADKYTD